MSSLRFSLAAAGALTILSATSGAEAQTYGSYGQTYVPYGYDYAPGVGYAPAPSRRRPPSAAEVYGEYEGRSTKQDDNYRYNFSGTRGRQDLGADSRHPEGPGNQSFPSFR